MIQLNEAKMASIIEGAVEQSLYRMLPIALKNVSQKEWLTTTEVMQILNCSRRHVQYLRDTNHIPFMRINRVIRYNRLELESYLLGRKITASKNTNQ